MTSKNQVPKHLVNNNFGWLVVCNAPSNKLK